VLEDPAFPGFRFQLWFDQTGRPIGWAMLPRPMLRYGKEPPEDDPGWGPTPPLTARAIRSVQFGDLERAARVGIGDLLSGLEELDTDLTTAELRRISLLRKAVAETRRPGPKVGEFALDDGHYASVARDYVIASRRSRSPAKDVGDQWGLSAKTIRNWLVEARTRGLLSDPESPGKAGGHLTDKGKRSLKARKGQ